MASVKVQGVVTRLDYRETRGTGHVKVTVDILNDYLTVEVPLGQEPDLRSPIGVEVQWDG